MNPRSEKVTSTFVESASIIHHAILKHTPCVRLLQAMSARFGPDAPLNSSSKLRIIVTKTGRSKELIMFTLEAAGGGYNERQGAGGGEEMAEEKRKGVSLG